MIKPISCYSCVLMIKVKKVSLECQNFSLSHEILLEIVSLEIMRNSKQVRSGQRFFF